MSSKASYFCTLNEFDFDIPEYFYETMTCTHRMAETGSDPFGEISFEKIFDLIEWNKVFHDQESGDNSKGHTLSDSQARGNKIRSSGPCFNSTSTPSNISQMLQLTGDIIELGTTISLHKWLINRRRRGG